LFTVKGFGGRPRPPEDIVDVANSGTTMNFAIGMASLAQGATVLTGDRQIKRRPVGPLIDALNALGADVFSTKNDGNPPVVVRNKIEAAKGGFCRMDAPVSQYLSSLLIHAPLFEKDTEIEMIRLLEVPYVEMTLWWLDKLGIRYENDNFKRFRIYGGQSYASFDETIPGDFSSATFFAVLAAASGAEIFMKNLNMSDVQGDKEVLRLLEGMGAKVVVASDGVSVVGGKLLGTRMDLNAMPDAICAMAVAGCFAEGETRIENVPQARLKETDRIAVMTTELKKMGADIEERDDGLVIRKSPLCGAEVEGHDDHRVVMSLAVAGLLSEGVTTVGSAEAVGVTFPEFPKLVEECGGDIAMID
jgi:3-phosphoshikimate 1-carboxyvinyltransferase